MAIDDEIPFWERKSLSEMTKVEWESLCDGCARCCLIKLEDVDSGDLAFTNVACDLLDEETCRCTDYDNRNQVVPTCIKVTPEVAGKLEWMPSTCAYRLLAEGKGLQWWHPLVSGEEESVFLAGIAVRGRIVHEKYVTEDDLEDHVVEWPSNFLSESDLMPEADV